MKRKEKEQIAIDELTSLKNSHIRGFSKSTWDIAIKAIEKVAEYAELEKQGRLHIAPLQEGETIWGIVATLEKGKIKRRLREVKYRYNFTELFGKIGEEWFLTKEDAEKAIKERRKRGKRMLRHKIALIVVNILTWIVAKELPYERKNIGIIYFDKSKAEYVKEGDPGVGVMLKNIYEMDK